MTLSGCTFCRIVRGESPAAVVASSDEIIAIMDLFPASRGHVLVLPKAHIEDIYALPEALAARLMACATAIAKALRDQLAPAGLNLIQANGEAAGQTIHHFHLHLVPRYPGDRVEVRFGHGDRPAEMEALVSLAAQLRAALGPRVP